MVLPVLKFCNLSYLQEILTDTKQALKLDEVQGPRPAILKYKEFAPKRVMPVIVKDPNVMRYFPEEVREQGHAFSDRIFTWTVLFKVKREWAN